MSDKDEDTWGDTDKTWADLKTIRVYASCVEEWVDEKNVTCIDCEEDAQGRDMVTFECPLCKATHKSVRRG